MELDANVFVNETKPKPNTGQIYIMKNEVDEAEDEVDADMT